MQTQFIKSQVCELSGGYFTLERHGQNPADVDDDVIVKATIYLPSHEETSTRLNKDLIFGNRLKFCGEALHYNWGSQSYDTKARYIEKYFPAPTWKEAFSDADNWVSDEFDKLRTIITQRKQALIDAEKI